MSSVKQSQIIPLGEPGILVQGRRRVEYFRLGATENPTVVLLPAFSRRVSEFNSLIHRLVNNGFQTIAVQTRGVGRSNSPIWPRSTLLDLTEDVVLVLREQGIENAHFIGRALGNRIARAIAWRHPELVRSLSLICAGGRVQSRQAIGFSYLFSHRARTKLLCAPGNPLPPEYSQPPTFRAALQQLPAVKRVPQGDWWLGGSARMLVIQGAQDLLAPPENGEELKRLAPSRVRLTTIENAGHMVLVEQFEKVCEELLAFLNTGQMDAGPHA